MTVERILRVKGRSVVTVPPDAALRQVVALLRDLRIGAVVVSGDGSRIEGIVSERDVVHRLAEKGADILEGRVADIMVRAVITCREHDTLDEIMQTMTRGRFRHVPVADEAGRLAGMISIGDVVKARLEDIQTEAESMREYIAAAG